MDMDVNSPSFRYSVGCANGFSLIELLLAVAIASILLMMVAPSFSELIQSNRLTGHLNQLLGHIHLARSEAIKTRQWVIVCISPDGMTCSSTSNWEEGWILFIDTDRDRQRDAGESILVVQQALEQDITIRYGAYPYYSRHFVLYYPDGRSLGNGTFTFCDRRGQTSARAMVLYKSGRVRSARRMPDGNELSCPTE